MHAFTPEDLILYLYKEAPTDTAAAIEKALQTDWTLREKFAVLKASHERLNTLLQSPRTEAVLRVLKYAAQKEKMHS